MKVFFCSILMLATFVSKAQDLQSYEVEERSLEALATKLGIEVTTLKKLNPHLKSTKDWSGKLIVVPAKSDFRLNPKVQLIPYDVSLKETLYSISKSYNLKVKDLKTYNPFLKNRELNYNDVLRIPTYQLKDKDLDINQSVKNSEFSTLMHLVLPKETKYGISRKYGISIEQLETLNPGIDEKEIQPGQFLKIKRPVESSEVKILKNKNYAFLKVDSQNSIRSISEDYDVTEEELLESNPSLKFEGISEGLVLKIPQIEEIVYTKYTAFPIEDDLKYFDSKKIAVMLPLQLEKTQIDTISPKSVIKNSALLRVSLDFYEGIQMAIDSAYAKGIPVDLDVFDTKNDPYHVNQLLNTSFKNYDAVVGPLLDPSLKVVASYLESSDVPVVSPLVNPKFEFDNLFRTLPKDEEMQEMMITYLQSIHTDENLVILADSISKPVQRKYTYTFPDIKTVYQAEPDYLQKSDLRPHLDSLGTNWVVLETENLGVAESTVSFLKSFQRDSFDIRLFTSKRSAFYEDEISNYYLSDLNFTFPSISKTQLITHQANQKNAFLEKHGIYPNKYVMRGYDVMMDLLLRLSYSKTLKESTEIEGFTEYTENKFNYKEKDFVRGVDNDAIYLLQYQKGLEIKALNLADFLLPDDD